MTKQLGSNWSYRLSSYGITVVDGSLMSSSRGEQRQEDSMKALYKTDTGVGNIELLDASIPEPGPGEVCIEVKAAGICGSDLHIYDGSINIPIRPPVIIGHEFAGTIHALGEGIDDWRVGDRITSETSVTICGNCPSRTSRTSSVSGLKS